MTTPGTPNNGTIDTAQIELETRYRLEFPGFEPATWAAMAYYSKGYPYEDVRLLLAQRFGDKVVADRDALVREAREAGSTAYNPNETIFEIDDVNANFDTIPE
jgi:hypothetical protein